MKLKDSEIQRLLEEDATKAHRSYLLLHALRPLLPEGFDIAAACYRTIHDAFNLTNYERTHADSFEEVARTSGIGLRELDRRLEGPNLTDSLAKARNADRRLIARQAQKYAFQLAWRAFRWAATDLRRLRINTAYGFQRQQAEAIGLMQMFADDPELAVEWFKPGFTSRKFFSKIQPKIKMGIKAHSMVFEYDHGSATSMHSTFAAGAAGSRFTAQNDHNVVVEILDDEVSESDPCVFHLAAGACLRTQQRVFIAVLKICPDIESEALTTQLAPFHKAVEDIWWTLDRRYGSRLRGRADQLRNLGLS